MIIECPKCRARYRIDPSKADKAVVRVKCPGCAHLFEIALAPGPPVATPDSTAGERPKVLVVDDSRYFRELVADVLKPLDLVFLMASEGSEALRIIRAERPALVILDLNLPGLSGQDLIRQVRTDSTLGGVRLFAMSGVFRKEADAVQVQAAGADDFLSKSFTPEQLQHRVRRLLAGRP